MAGEVILDRAAVELVARTTNFERDMTRAAKHMITVGTQMQAAGRNLQRYVTLPLTLAGAAALKMGRDFEKSMTSIETLVGVNRGLVNEWRKDLVKLGPEVAKGPNELARAMFVVTSAGERGADALKVVEAAAKASAIGLGDTAVIARGVTAAMQAYKVQGLTAADATDILTATVREGNLEASALAGAFTRVLAPAAAVGASLRDVGAFIATYTRVSGSAEEAVTSLGAALNIAIKPAQGARDAMAEAGYSVEQFRKAIKEKGLQSALQQLLDATKGNDDALGQFLPNLRALRGVLATVGSQSEVYAGIAKNLANTQNLVNDAFDRTTQDSAFKLEKAYAQLQAAGTALGGELLPPIGNLAQSIGKLAQKFSELEPGVLRTTIKFAALAAAIGPVMRIMGFLITRTGILISLSLVQSLVGWVAGMGALAKGVKTAADRMAWLKIGMESIKFPAWIGKLARALGPGGAIVLGTIGIVGAFDRWAKKTNEAKEAAKEHADELERAARAAMVGGMIGERVSITGSYGDEIARTFEMMKQKMDEMRNAPNIAAPSSLIPAAAEFEVTKKNFELVLDTAEALRAQIEQTRLDAWAAAGTEEAADLTDELQKAEAALRRIQGLIDNYMKSQGIGDSVFLKTFKDLPKQIVPRKAAERWMPDPGQVGIQRSYNLGLSNIMREGKLPGTGLFDKLKGLFDPKEFASNFAANLASGFATGGISLAVDKLGSAALKFASGVFGAGSRFEAQQRERERVMRDNNAALDRLNKGMAKLDAGALFGDPTLGGVKSAVSGFVAAMHNFQGGVDQAGERILGPSLSSFAVQFGVTMEDIERVAEAFDIQLDGTTRALAALAEAINSNWLRVINETFSGGWSMMQTEFELLDIKNPMERFRRQVDFVAGLVGEDLAAALRGLDASNIDAWLAQFIQSLKDGTFDIAQLNGLSIDEFIRFITSAESALDELTSSADSAAQSLLHVPAGFKTALAIFKATQADSGAVAGAQASKAAASSSVTFGDIHISTERGDSPEDVYRKFVEGMRRARARGGGQDLEYAT